MARHRFWLVGLAVVAVAAILVVPGLLVAAPVPGYCPWPITAASTRCAASEFVPWNRLQKGIAAQAAAPTWWSRPSAASKARRYAAP